MPRMRAFRGFVPNVERVEPGNVICPPYDVIPASLHEQLLNHAPENAVRWILGDDPEAELDANVFRQCGESMRSAVAEGTIVAEERPAIYRYSIRYGNREGGTSLLEGVVAVAEARPWGEGVERHEEIRPYTVARLVDQARLTTIDTGVVQLSCEGLEDVLAEVEAGPEAGELVFESADYRGDVHTLRRIDDPQHVRAIEAALEPLPSAVADGHHRYTTALELSGDDQLIGGGYVLAFIGDLRQDGLHIHPTHRIWNWNPAEGPDQETVAEKIVEVLDDGEGEPWKLVSTSGKEWNLKTLADMNQPTLARRLADVIAEFPELGAPTTPHVEEEARDQLSRSENGILCLLPPVGKEEFWSRTLAQEVFPPKTTFFEPKISTGMVVRYTDEEDV
ncbi:MAG: hypothetical protein CBC13_10150 [Planctomycetia bacterium TMED53]|nr:MAG: hypothetical protein CBC13_10150 [Planctomycetia bacterium TMED53]